MKSLTFHPVSTKILEINKRCKSEIIKRPSICNINLNLQGAVSGHLLYNQIFVLVNDLALTPQTPKRSVALPWALHKDEDLDMTPLEGPAVESY